MSPTHVRYHALSHVFFIFSLTLALDYVISRGAQVLVANQKRHIIASNLLRFSEIFI